MSRLKLNLQLFAATTFADVKFDPELFMEYMEELSPEPTAFVRSGIIRKDPAIASSLTEGNILTIPFFKPLGGASQNYGGTDITVNGITSGTQTAVVIGRANAWGSQDLAAELASKDPMLSIAQKVAKYWQEEWQRIIFKQLNGIFKSASMATHVHDVAIEDGNNALEANLMGADVVIDAIQKSIGDNGSKIVAMAVHSKVYARLQKLNLIEYKALSEQSMLVPTFLGKEIIVDDTITNVAGTTSGRKYDSYLFAKDAIGEADAKVKNAAETERDSLKSGGMEWLVNRYRRVYHMYGTNFTKTALAGISPTDAELETATNWTKVYEDKNIPVLVVRTNG